MAGVETVTIKSTSISCYGNEAPLDHPKVYLKINGKTASVVCPYCRKKFVYKSV